MRWRRWLPSTTIRPKSYGLLFHPACQKSVHRELFKRKAWLVICRNFEGKVQEEVYASGCQGETSRAILAHACPQQSWTATSTDIRNAFVLAPMPTDAVYALRAPKVFVPNSKQLWRVDPALYGFRRSPRLWSTFRDARPSTCRVPAGGQECKLEAA